MPPLRELVSAGFAHPGLLRRQLPAVSADADAGHPRACLETLLGMLTPTGCEQTEHPADVRRRAPPQDEAGGTARHGRRAHLPRLLSGTGCANFDAEDPRRHRRASAPPSAARRSRRSRAVLESDLVIYVDTIQIPLNGGHKSVAVGLVDLRQPALHHAPQMTAESPHVMQPRRLAHARLHRALEPGLQRRHASW